ncbi:arylsulfatase [Aporhodopirellula aestuarii]|uniref:Arylsulfatase n=1 Tax=Aporhodopirellula aestuarii TaxID=2950107 RepID=A0ABT0U949_9BACT|nr:arylsulfatase [Aporhodopirellula aestuarii]MCM2373447.1 arylsulfatase [Aporhodopirellula aestuarii]
MKLRTSTESAWFLIAALVVAQAIVGSEFAAADRPNVILIMTDDQGYGDLSCHGNPILSTPNLDRLHSESVRLTDFHVSPLCAPTRAGVMTGRYPARTGAYRAGSGRSLMHPDEVTIANIFDAAGYATGMIGKWHLGDNAPHRPQDRGFQDVVWHRSGEVGQASDYWGNDYFDDTYERNGSMERFEGYCTDVWFSESIRFIEENRHRPFFLYLATNAPHRPYLVDPQWSEPYRGIANWSDGDQFYGMIANVDHNLGVLRERLEALGLAENTILVFMTDNGTECGGHFEGLDSEAIEGFNAGMRGKSLSIYEGGHRVPFFIRWPDGGIEGGRDCSSLAAHIDVLPTIAELCEIEVSHHDHLDGISFAKQLTDDGPSPHRDHLVVQLHGGPYFDETPKPWEYACVLKDRWRLINGSELYDIEKDPAQRTDVASSHSDVVAEMRERYVTFWELVSRQMFPVAIDIGNPADNPTTLCSQDWYLKKGIPPSNFASIKELPRVVGPWNVNVYQAGLYRLTLRQLPVEADRPVVAVRARVKIAGHQYDADVLPDSRGVKFEMILPAGQTQLWTYLFDENGRAGGAYFTEVERLTHTPRTERK